MYILHLCTWNHVWENLVEALQAVASTQTSVIGHVHTIDGSGACHRVQCHVWRVLDTLQMPLLTLPQLINGVFKYTYIDD